MLAEGLDKKPLRDIVAMVSELQFNFVRLTWATFMFTRYGQVLSRIDSLGLREAKDGILKNNPVILNMALVRAYETVVDELGAQGLMVVLDNHFSKPYSCCQYNDGNGFFGDNHFHPQEWLEGLITVANGFKTKNQVVAMSLRNEQRSSRQNEHDRTKLGDRPSFLEEKVTGLDLNNKLVYETHWYSFSGDQQIWEVQPLNRVCAISTQLLKSNSGFLTSGRNPIPLFFSEFGFDQTDPNSNLSTSYILYHPGSGKCIGANVKNEVYTSNSRRWWSRRWSNDGDGGPIRLMGSALCLKVEGDGLPPILSRDCLSQQSACKSVSKSYLHLAAKDEHGQYLCLDYKSANSSKIFNRKCICIDDDDSN
ncbi:hypothetical protein LWI28_016551 [Acer negundo]|uniref:Uncharacterized protein n=1 Tax=Acer negundo TaxID=4023 RepID=A0AAD5IQP0_ACENE|nr:hypothetical protein LWI28_016551 [Acer negundo]